MSADDKVHWDERYAAGTHASLRTSPFLRSLDELLPRSGRALDIAGGAGRNALWLAERGLAVTIADISEVGLGIARARAAERGLPLETVALDLAEEAPPPGPWDLVLSVLYLERSLFAAFPHILAPGGLLVFLQPTVTNLERHEKPPRPFLLERDEIRSLVSDLDILHLEESWSDDGFHEARLVAQRPA